MTPQQRTLKLVKENGYLPWVVEAWVPHAGKRLDFYGFGDVFAVPGPKCRGSTSIVIQTTTFSNRIARVEKIRASPYARHILKAGIGIEVHGWKRTKDGWTSNAVRISLECLTSAAFGGSSSG